MDELFRAKLRRLGARFLTERCVIEREMHTVGAYGDPIRAWALVAADVPCRVIVARRSDLSAVSITAGRETLQDIYRLTLPHDSSITVDDRVTVGGAIFHVVRVETELTDAVFTTVILSRRL
jgi:head-tail adaptor